MRRTSKPARWATWKFRLTNEERVVTIYEMKSKEVTIADMDRAFQKIASRVPSIDNYVFITTEAIDGEVETMRGTLYEKTAGTEVVVLNCIGFIRHFLHLFHRARITFSNAYRALLLAEPDSSVRQPLKEAFLSLRQSGRVRRVRRSRDCKTVDVEVGSHGRKKA